MSLTNPMGDLEITDPQTMRALAHPVRLRALSHLQRSGPATATQLAEHVGASPSVTSWHLRHLASFGLVADDADPAGGTDRRQRWWRAVAPGIRFEIPDSPEGASAGRLLADQLVSQAIESIRVWTTETLPKLDARWSRLAESGNTGMWVTPAEVEEIHHTIDELLGTYVRRGHEGAPPEAREVRLIRFTLPTSSGTGEGPA